MISQVLYGPRADVPHPCFKGFCAALCEKVASQESQSKWVPPPCLAQSAVVSCVGTRPGLWAPFGQDCLGHDRTSNISRMLSQLLEGKLNGWGIDSIFWASPGSHAWCYLLQAQLFKILTMSLSGGYYYPFCLHFPGEETKRLNTGQIMRLQLRLTWFYLQSGLAFLRIND